MGLTDATSPLERWEGCLGLAFKRWGAIHEEWRKAARGLGGPRLPTLCPEGGPVRPVPVD